MSPTVSAPMTTASGYPMTTAGEYPGAFTTTAGGYPMITTGGYPMTTSGDYPGVFTTSRQLTPPPNPFGQPYRTPSGVVTTIPPKPVTPTAGEYPGAFTTTAGGYPMTTSGDYPGVFTTSRQPTPPPNPFGQPYRPQSGVVTTIPPKPVIPRVEVLPSRPAGLPSTLDYNQQLRSALGTDNFQRRVDTAAAIAGVAALGGLAGYGLGTSGNNAGMQSPAAAEQESQMQGLMRLNSGLQSGGPPPTPPLPAPTNPAARTAPVPQINTSPVQSGPASEAPAEVSAIDRAVQASQMANPVVSEPAYDSSQALQSLDQSSDAFTQGLNILRQRGFRDNPNRAAALLADAQGYNPNVLRSAAQSLGGYDTRWSPGGEFNPNQSPLSEAEMAGIRNAEQYRQGSMMTPGGLVSRFGRGGPMGLQALAAQQSERDAEQDFRMRSRMAADQRLLDMSNPMTPEGLANITEGQMPASPTDPFQRRSSTFAYLNPANAGVNNPRGVTGTNRLGMLRMMQAQGQIPEGSDLASELSTEEAIAQRNREARRSPKYQEAVRETLQNRAAQKRATSEDRALSRYLKQGYSPTDPFLQQRFPGAVQRWADNLGIGQRQAYGFGDAGQGQGSSMESPLSTFVQGTAPTAEQLADSSNLLAHVTAPEGEFTSIDSPGFGVFAAYRQGQPGAFTDPSTIEEKLQASLSGDPSSVSLNVDNLKALQMYARAVAASPELKRHIDNERTPGLVSLLNANFDANNGLQSFHDDNRNRKQTVRKAKQAELTGDWYSPPVNY